MIDKNRYTIIINRIEYSRRRNTAVQGGMWLPHCGACEPLHLHSVGH